MTDKEIPLTAWEKTLSEHIRSLQPGFFIQTVEEVRAIYSITKTIQHLARHGYTKKHELRVWSRTHVDKLPIYSGEKEEVIQNVPLFNVLSEFCSRFSEQTVEGETRRVGTPETLVLTDIVDVLQSDAAVRRKLKETFQTIRRWGWPKSIVLLNKPERLPRELEPHVAVMDFDLPTQDELKEVFDLIIGQYQQLPEDKRVTASSPEILSDVARACTGITEDEARQLMCLNVVRHKRVDERTVTLALKEKAKIVKRDNVLEIIEPKVKFAEVGGLENFKNWVEEVTPDWIDPKDTKSYGMKTPSGILLAGVPGCGKSYSVEALANKWDVLLLNFDVGSAFGKHVGESEGNIRRLIQTAKACAPCIVFIDEIEKALGGDSMDGGTTSRVKQTLLTWMQNKPENVFLAATANDLGKLEKIPELVRPGRIDATFFVDLPDMRSRLEILGIHLKRAGHTPGEKMMEQMVPVGAATQGYSGAELERVVQTALRIAYRKSPRPEHPGIEELMAATQRQKPLSVTMKESIDHLRTWCQQGRAEPAGKTLESEKADTESFHQAGLPMID